MQLNREEEKFIAKWTRLKAQGRWRYTLTRGLLWGVLVSLVSQLFQVWDRFKAWDTAALAEVYTSTDYLTRLFIFSAIGLGLHAYHWNNHSKRYSELLAQQRRAVSAMKA